jgi:hypothetical protein
MSRRSRSNACPDRRRDRNRKTSPIAAPSGHARAPADYADPDVVEMDQPRFAMVIVFAAAAVEQGHAPSKR